MRFSAAIQPQPPLRSPAVAEAVRGSESHPLAQHPQPVLPRADDLPLDLDQRVRLIGEW